MKIFCVLAVLLGAALSLHAVDSRDADTAFNAYNGRFYAVGSNGFAYFKENTEGGHSHFWIRAEQIEMIEDAWDRTHSDGARQMVQQAINGFIHGHGTDWTTNEFNDDIMWMTIACARGYQITGDGFYRDLGRHNFDAVYSRGYDHVLGGGLYWTTDGRSKNACVNGPGAIAACLLCQICNDKTCLEKAKSIFAWERGSLFNTNTGAVYDNMRVSGHIGRKTYTYNEGTFIGAADLLWKLTGETNYLNDALLAANFTRHQLSHDGTLPAYGSGDAAGFNGIFARWMARFLNDAHLWPQFYNWMSYNANAAWRVRRADDLSWQDWNWQTPGGTLDSWNCSDAVVMLQVVPAELPK
jgi:predicted alpha-1,6-mannanase (GH76 family)